MNTGNVQMASKEGILSNPIHLKKYFTDNDNNTVTLWAAHKTVIRGKQIQLSSQLKGECKAEIQKLIGKFLAVSKQHKHSLTTWNLSWLETARTHLNFSLTTATKKHLRWSGVKFYLQKDKIVSRLATKLSPKPHTL